jgi:integrase
MRVDRQSPELKRRALATVTRIAKHENESWQTLSIVRRALDARRPDDFVFGTSVGTAVCPDNFTRCELKAAVTAANKNRAETELPAIPAFTWHSLRHYAVSQLIEQGAAVTLVARIAGHSDPAVTLRVYSHLLEAALADAATRYDPLRVKAG